MDLRQASYVVAVVDHQTFTAAAASIPVSQPALSQAIASLERELGADLFHRIGRQVVLTPAGEAFVDPAVQRHRIGIRLFAELLGSRPEERTALAVTETNTRVWRALQGLKFQHVGDLVPFPGWRSHRMLVRALPLSSSR